jgi:hypothetical protein
MAVCCTHWHAVRRYPKGAHRHVGADQLEPHGLLPEHRRWCSLSRLPLIDDGFASGADASGQAVLCESEPTTKSPQLLVVVVRDRDQRSRTNLLPAESAVVPGHELLSSEARGQSSGPTKHGLHGEVRVEPASSDGRLQRAKVNVQFFGQLAERQQLRLLRMMFNRRPSPQEHWDRHRPQPAVPHPERIHGYVEQLGKVTLREIRVATQLAKLVHAEHTMPSAGPVVKRPPAYLARDHDHVRHDSARSGNGCLEKCSGKARIASSRECGAHSQD